MSRTIVLELSDSLFSAIRHHAHTHGISPELWVASTLEQQYGQKELLLAEAKKQAARERFEDHFGELDLGNPVGVENEQIDADLAIEYSNQHIQH